jgi:S-formylglutathione hydrolase
VGVEGEDESWDFGTGAGFYIDATQPPWSENYKMYSYITEELPDVVFKEFPLDSSFVSITGHSMGINPSSQLVLRGRWSRSIDFVFAQPGKV